MRLFVALAAVLLAGCSSDDSRVVDRDETLLTVSATGRNETQPDMATFLGGVETYAKSADMKIARVRSINDGGSQSLPVEPYYDMRRTGPPPVISPQSASPRVRTGRDIDVVAVPVQFALELK